MRSLGEGISRSEAVGGGPEVVVLGFFADEREKISSSPLESIEDLPTGTSANRHEDLWRWVSANAFVPCLALSVDAGLFFAHSDHD